MRQWYLPRHSPSNSDTQDRTKARSCTEAPLAGRDYKTALFSFILVYMVNLSRYMSIGVLKAGWATADSAAAYAGWLNGV